MGFLAKVNDLVKNADWYNITEIEATLFFFQQDINCAQSKQICSESIKTNPEGDIEKLADQLTGLKISKQPTPTKLNCTNCGRAGNLTINFCTIRRLAKPSNVLEASGAKLNIIGTCDMYVKLKVIGKTKQL